MSMRQSLLTIIALTTFHAAASAADLARIDRTIRNEPAYQGQPKYCLLVFGPEAKTRVWLVQDGATLYVDRNGNGDLTEPDEKIAAKKTDEPADDGVYTFAIGQIADGELTHREVTMYTTKIDYLADEDQQIKKLLDQEPNLRGCRIHADVQVPGLKGAGLGGRIEQAACTNDIRGLLRFANKPQDAPIIHFGGPLQVTFWDRPTLRVGRGDDIILGVGTLGVGPGTTAWVAYSELIPETAFPKLEVAYPPSVPDGPPVKELYELKQRC